MIFAHTAREPGMWRGWFKSGESLEITWPRTPVGVKITTFDNDDDRTARKSLWIGLGLVQAYIPLWIVPSDWPPMDGPEWGVSFSREFGIWLSWRFRWWAWSWPFHVITLAWDYETTDGWQDVLSSDRRNEADEYDPRPDAKRETHPYTYVLRSGKVQQRQATIIRERWIMGRHILSRLGWPSRTRYAIDVRFDGEVGERSGSWKGGVVGCGYNMKPGETPLETLRRMERERSF